MNTFAKLGSRGGTQRAARLTKRELSAAGKLAAHARWRRYRATIGDLLTLEQAAVASGVPPSQLRQLPEARKIAGVWRIPIQAVARLVV